MNEYVWSEGNQAQTLALLPDASTPFGKFNPPLIPKLAIISQLVNIWCCKIWKDIFAFVFPNFYSFFFNL